MNTSGIGLGLVISECLVEKLNGKITFESTEKKGSTFTFTVKLDDKNQIPSSSNALANSCDFNVNPKILPNKKKNSNAISIIESSIKTVKENFKKKSSIKIVKESFSKKKSTAYKELAQD